MIIDIKKDMSPGRKYIDLWRQTFGDSEDYIQSVLNAGSYYCAVSAEANGELVGAAHLLSLSGGNAYYCYAVAVSKQFRGQGIGRAVMKYIEDFCIETGASVFLHPASASLCGFYSSLDFRPVLFRSAFRCEGDKGAYSRISADEYGRIRELSFGGSCFFGWNSDMLALTGFTFIGFDVDGEYCAAAVDDNCIHEVCASPLAYGRAVRRAASFCKGAAEVYSLSEMPIGAEIAVMAYNYDGDLYFNFFLD